MQVGTMGGMAITMDLRLDASSGVLPNIPVLMLLDAATLYFRAYYGVKEDVVAPDGSPVNAVRGFLDSIARLVNDHGPTRLVA